VGLAKFARGHLVAKSIDFGLLLILQERLCVFLSLVKVCHRQFVVQDEHLIK
jgi:hypothetical protein